MSPDPKAASAEEQLTQHRAIGEEIARKIIAKRKEATVGDERIIAMLHGLYALTKAAGERVTLKQLLEDEDVKEYMAQQGVSESDLVKVVPEARRRWKAEAATEPPKKDRDKAKGEARPPKKAASKNFTAQTGTEVQPKHEASTQPTADEPVTNSSSSNFVEDVPANLL